MIYGTWDLETQGLGGSFLCAGAYSKETGYKYFEDLGLLLDFIISSKVMLWYAHNSGKYDIRYLMDILLKRAYIVKPIIIHGSIANLKVYIKNKKICEFRDSYFLLPSSLDKLTKDYDVEHKKNKELIVDYNKLKINDTLKEYLYNDVLGLFEVIEKNVEYIFRDLGVTPSLTFGATALNTFKTLFPKDFKKIVYIDNKNLRSGYFGGRTEVFRTYLKNGYYYDVNSLYPYVMHNFKFPVGNYFLSSVPKSRLYIAEIEFTAPKSLNIPILPVKLDNKLIFGVGTSKGVYCSAEIEKAVEYGYKIKYKKVYNFKDEDYIFRGYVDYFYNIKSNSKRGSAQYNISKLYLNSLYGKFGQRPNKDMYIFNPSKEWVKRNFREFECLNFDTFEIWKKEYIFPNKWVNISLMIFITAYARLELFKIFERVGFEHVYYCDTDSVFTDVLLDTSNDLGALKLEDTIEEAIFLRPKVYSYKNDSEEICIKAKGMKTEMLSYEDFKTALNNEDYTGFIQETDNIGGFKTTLKRFGKWIYRYHMEKGIKSQYTKRIIQKDGTTKAINI